jgi:hypothetical protein
MTAYEDARRDVQRILWKRPRPAGFEPTCHCGTRNWIDAKTCEECGSRLYPSRQELKGAAVKEETDRG